MRRFAWIVVFVFAMAALPAMAQEEDRGPITWLAFSKVKPGQTEAAVKLTLEDKELMDRLMADGTVMSWGLGMPINHNPGDLWNHVQWVTLESWDKIDAWVGAVMQTMTSMDEETQKARMKRAEEIYVDGSHFDEVMRHNIISSGNGAAPKYYYLADFTAQPGKGEGLVKFFGEQVVPVLDKLVADGALTSYGAATAELHLDTHWTHRFWYGLPNLGAIDRMSAAFQAARTPARDAWAQSLFEMRGHYDVVLMVLHSDFAKSE